MPSRSISSELKLRSDEIPEMIASIETLNSGFCLTDPADPRYQFLAGLKQRFGTFLHNASVSLRQQGEENTVDAVDMLVSDIIDFS
jgi:proteasome activator subunit 4